MAHDSQQANKSGEKSYSCVYRHLCSTLVYFISRIPHICRNIRWNGVEMGHINTFYTES